MDGEAQPLGDQVVSLGLRARKSGVQQVVGDFFSLRQGRHGSELQLDHGPQYLRRDVVTRGNAGF